MTDAVVIGAGPNGLVAANVLADAGWSVLVLEAEPDPGGAMRSAEVTAPGFGTDLFSAFYPLAAASPVLRALDLQAWGLEWVHAPAVLAHPLPGGRCAVLSRDPEATAASLDAFAAGDGARWQAVYAEWRRLREPLLDALFRPFPPVRPATRLLRAQGLPGVLRLARRAVLPVRRYAEEEFRGEGAAALLAGNALHTDLGPDSAGSAAFGWLLAMLGQDVGFPVPRGGAGRLTDALVRRLAACGGRVVCGSRVDEVVVRGGRAVGVRTADGQEAAAARAVVADVDPQTLYRQLLAAEHLPARLLADLDRFTWDAATVKLDWALCGPVPWAVPGPTGAGTVHLGGGIDDLARFSAELACGRVPAQPFVVFGQMTTTDPSRSPAGTESAWGYTHVPRAVRGDAGGDGITGAWDAREAEAIVRRIEAQVEQVAPGFRDRILARHVQLPADLEARDANLRGGAINGGSAAIHQQLVFRPVPGTGRPETPVRGLYLGSASAHPGGGVHGGPGANAARAALAGAGLLGPARRGLLNAADRLLRG